MPWDLIHLNSGNIAFGTRVSGDGQNYIDQVERASDNGFNHVGKFQSYRNETEAGTALRESGLIRLDRFITIKCLGTNGLDIDTPIQEGVANLGVDYVDLYLIHSPHYAVPDISTAWLIEAPTVNQILFHPYVYRQQSPVLGPITKQTGGPLDAPLNDIASRLGATADQVLLTWTKAKGAVVFTYARSQGYLAAGDIELTQEGIAALTIRKLAADALVGATVFGACSYFNICIF
ncbi:hypothetical protein PAXRUDRAFT_30005 [Paxillus rubicundulus Ve08.2h10]|uniref:NADP-dependent oxidoreductase domain-containing protein n=1 Tax=Paxillus rubicundulus Ve08.2h10 TaxID=930991 RepID=A0A0D0E5T5_9AGAM|nr:hypothetical protein PAXRUDRAFT_30005 [Paxillus rubicundulus Ve08.2h10]